MGFDSEAVRRSSDPGGGADGLGIGVSDEVVTARRTLLGSGASYHLWTPNEVTLVRWLCGMAGGWWADMLARRLSGA